MIGLKCALDLGLLRLCLNSTEASTGIGNVDSILHEYRADSKGLEN